MKLTTWILATIFSLTAQAQTLDQATTVEVKGQPAAHWNDWLYGVVVDNSNNKLSGVEVVIDGKVVKTDANGSFTLPTHQSASSIMFLKPGYRKVQADPQSSDNFKITLSPLEIKSLYMQPGFIYSKQKVFMDSLELLKNTEINALTIDVKGDWGGHNTGLTKIVSYLHSMGIYVIARVVTFKDNVETKKHPENAIQDRYTGKPWLGAGNTMFLNPYLESNWDYVIGIAKQAVDEGFDEVQFDYVRFPSDGKLSSVAWSGSYTERGRSAEIAGFLQKAHAALSAKGAFVAADVFGITAYDSNDSGIGQKIETITPYLDYVCPMLYPSGFGYNTEGLGTPVDYPEEIIQKSSYRYRVRAEKINSELVLRPWLQAFQDYAFNHKKYGAAEIAAQIKGAKAAGAEGFLLWNAGSQYTDAGLKPKRGLKLAMK